MPGSNVLETITRLLFLCAYTLGAAGLFLPVFSRRGTGGRPAKTAGRFLQLLTITGIIPSLQVILDAFGIIDSLPKPWQTVLVLVFNNLILLTFGFLVLAWDSLTLSLKPAPIPSDRFRKPGKISAVAVLAVNIGLQIAALTTRNSAVLTGARYGLIVLFAVLAIIGLNSTIRVMPGKKRRDERFPGSVPIRLIPAVFLIFVITYNLASSPWKRLLPPTALIALIILSILVFLKNSRESSAPNTLSDRLFNESGMTPREREIARMLAEGLSYKEISGRLFISLSTTQTHVSRIYGKLGVNSKTELSLKLGGRSKNES